MLAMVVTLSTSQAPMSRLKAAAAERLRAGEHARHGGDLIDVPSTDVSVEGGRGRKHSLHGCDLADVPGVEGLVEDGRAVEQTLQVSDLAHVPPVHIVVPSGDVAIRVGKQAVPSYLAQGHARRKLHIPRGGRALRPGVFRIASNVVGSGSVSVAAPQVHLNNKAISVLNELIG